MAQGEMVPHCWQDYCDVVVADARFRLLTVAANNMARCRAVGARAIEVGRWFALALLSLAHAWTSF